MNRNVSSLAVLLASAGLASAASLPAAPAGLTNIGIAAAVRGAIKAQAPGQAVGRDVTSGKPVFLNDHVTTGAGARMQILLLDETTFTIGPNSDMLLDEFVYDPNTGAGKVSAQITKGVFRFVTGKVAQRNPSDMKVKLPVGTIGIRGTMVEGSVDGQNADILLTGPGPQNNANERPGGITVSNGAGSTSIDASGYGTSIVNGGAPSSGYRFSPSQVGAIQGQLTGPASASNGGSSNNAAGGGNGSTGGSGEGGRTASSGGGSEGSATQASGQGSAEGGVTYETTAGNIVAQNNDTSNFAAQQTEAAGTQDGLSTWDQILAIPSGTGQYSGFGSYACDASLCGTAGSGSANFTLNADFGAKTLGGPGSNLVLSGLNFFSGDSSGINTISYANLSGPSSLNITGAMSNSNFNSVGLELDNKGGTVAGEAVITFGYQGFSGGNASGQLTGGLGPMPPQ